jgi:transposase
MTRFGDQFMSMDRYKVKQCRRVATRYDKLAADYLAVIRLVAIRIWLRAHESIPEVSLQGSVT